MRDINCIQLYHDSQRWWIYIVWEQDRFSGRTDRVNLLQASVALAYAGCENKKGDISHSFSFLRSVPIYSTPEKLMSKNSYFVDFRLLSSYYSQWN